MKRLLIFLVSFLFFVSSVFIGQAAAVGKYRHTLIAATSRAVKSLDPHTTVERVSLLPICNVYERLVDYAETSTEIEPSLATSWSVSENGKTWTFKLRKGVKFHDGSQLDAQAVKYSFERLLTLKRGAASTFYVVDKIDIKDDYTVAFHLKVPFGPFLALMASVKGVYIMSPSWVKKQEVNGDWAVKYAQNHMNGTGPFKLERWSPGQEVVLKRNKDYWRGWPKDKYLDTIVIKVIREEVGRRLALKSGEVDFLNRSISPEEFKLIKDDPNIRTMTKETFNVVHIPFNCSRPPLNNPKLRKAINYAFDYKNHIEGIMRGNVDEMKMIGPLSRSIWGHYPKVVHYHRDLDKAKELLREAGYKPGELTLEINHTKGTRWIEQMMQLLMSNLDEIGIKSKVKTMTYTALLAKWRNPKTRGDIYTFYRAVEADDPYILLDTQYHSKAYFNLMGYKNEDVDKLLVKARETINKDVRKELYGRVQELIASDAPMIWPCQMTGLFASRKYVKGIKFNVARFDDWDYYPAYIEE